MISELSIVIPTLNEANYLPILLHSIASQNVLPEKYEVIVVDGESTDATIEKAKEFTDLLLRLKIIESKRGIGRQRNKGAFTAKYKFLLFLDADMVLPQDFFKELLPHVSGKDERFIATTMLWSTEKNILDTCVFLVVLPFILIFLARHRYTPGALTLTTKKNHEEIHGYREDIIFGEDRDYGERSLLNGSKFYIFWSVIALHSPRRMRMQGRFKVFWLWLQGYLKSKKSGDLTEKGMIDYPYGQYK